VDGVGRAFAEALARKDFAALAAALDPEVDFRGMTPSRVWEARDPDGVVAVLRQWFEPEDEIDELVAVETDGFADRGRVGYRLRVHNPDGRFVGEQQAYYALRDGRIAWMRVLCSGFRPLDG
jgi:hypothetical protein